MNLKKLSPWQSRDDGEDVKGEGQRRKEVEEERL
jgi:hypothetical protein